MSGALSFLLAAVAGARHAPLRAGRIAAEIAGGIPPGAALLWLAVRLERTRSSAPPERRTDWFGPQGVASVIHGLSAAASA